MASNLNSLSRFFILICVTLMMVMLSSSPTVVDAGGLEQLGMEWIHQTKTICEGSIADCMLQQGEEEFEFDNEINRRILATTKYISYGALQRNTVPCSRRGASYYNCRPGAQANPYTRGCSAITRCRS
ncbi:protein RALF-like 33 [Cicer arietinum]|uniref:Protein RALF-like 33 n=1 Tax=Cicer arietinum TaxID=3827 RepID=A0A1S2XU79_CICAR|nr:protein RALF-like 33 [Cicer arietinum]